MIRFVDVTFALLGLTFGLPVMVVILVAGFFDTGSPIFFQRRVGMKRRPFTLIKFRTMRIGTASVATHLADATMISPLGRFLRKTKLDELPQLWNVLKGEMSLVGPRPCLESQVALIDEREARGIFEFRPGITGLAQINNIDMSTPQLLAETDRQMLASLNLKTYFIYIIKTVAGGGSGDALPSPKNGEDDV